jgi:hypothetical protein
LDGAGLYIQMFRADRKPRRKLIYPIGLLSLSILPLLCFNSLYQKYLYRDSLSVIEVSYWNPADTAYNPFKYVNEKFTKITFDGTDDNSKLKLGQVEIRELLTQRDTTLGIEFTLTDNAKYSTLVALFNICEIEGAWTYLHYKDKFWVFNIWHNRREKNVMCNL